jgi:hypothetical protein
LWRQLVLRLCLFHALLLERRHYRGLSWRLPYDFSGADFGAAVKQASGARLRVADGYLYTYIYNTIMTS